MDIDADALIVRCQAALQMTQAELGELLGVHKRTIQRWQGVPLSITPSQAERLAAALRSVQPDLAERVLELGRRFAERTGMLPPLLPATPEAIDEVVRAAAEAGGTSPEAIRPAVVAAFAKAQELDLEVREVVAGIDDPRAPKPTP
jgi:hypothetical protein